MEENTQLPNEVVEQIEKEAEAHNARLKEHAENEKDVAYAQGFAEGWHEGVIAYATQLHQANETIKVLSYDNNRLKGEVEGLNRWKEEAKAIINPIWDYADTLKLPLGASKTEAVVKHANEAKKLLNEVFQKHESGLLPDRFIYDKIKKFLYGE